MMPADKLTFEWLPGEYAVCRLDADSPLPEWAKEKSGPLLNVSWTENELSIVIDAERVPPSVGAQRGFAALRVAGVLDFQLVGILAQLTGTLAKAHIPVFAVSTHDTDYLLVPASKKQETTSALAQVGRWAG